MAHTCRWTFRAASPWETPNISEDCECISVSLKPQLWPQSFPLNIRYGANSSRRLMPYPLCGTSGQLPLRFSYKASQQRKLLCWSRQQEAAGSRDGGMAGRTAVREGWMAAEEVYSCLQAGRRSSRRSLWRRPSCRRAANTEWLHVSCSVISSRRAVLCGCCGSACSSHPSWLATFKQAVNQHCIVIKNTHC